MASSSPIKNSSPARQYAPIVLILIAYLLAGTLYAVYTPDWQAPDEPAHYNYIRQLADGRFPIMQPGDYDQAYQEQVVGSAFDPQYSVATFEYEDYQPPLYYLLESPVFLLFDGAIRPLRLLSVLFGAGIVLLAYLIAQRLFPTQSWLWPTTAAFVAFVPQHVAMLAAINNDSLAELLIAAILYTIIRISSAERPSNHQLVALGILMGLGFLTKATVYLMVPVIGLYLLWTNWREWRPFFRQAVVTFGVAGLIGLPWWLRNVGVYGGVDILGIFAHNGIVTGQPTTAEWITNYGLGFTIRHLFQTTFQSFWGQFGWMGVVMRPWVYQPLLLFTVLTIIGLTLFFWQRKGERSSLMKTAALERPTMQSGGIYFAILAGTFALSLILFLTYNLTFVQHQGRYLFPGLIPIAIAVALAWTTLIQPLSNRWKTAVYLIPLGLALALFGLDLLALFRFIIPAFNG
ncbi:MAG: glycosyltransferase family 39 protein [Candidatus Promineifilaceae bacterium]